MMQPDVHSYIEAVDEKRRSEFRRLVETIENNIPDGFVLTASYRMIGWVVPHSLYPDGYHCEPKQPLPFINLAVQKHHIAIYHLGLYSCPSLMDWFVTEYPKHCTNKPNMGKSCIRFRNPKQLPFSLIGALSHKMTVHDWTVLYQNSLRV